MKKVLLGTTALVGLFAGTAFAQGPAVNVGGFIDFQAGFSDQDFDTTGATSRDVKFQNDTEVHVSVDGKSDNGLGYGAVIELEADVTADGDGEGLNADKTYIFGEGGFGRVELGNNVSAADALQVDAGTIARATGGTDGDFYDYVNLTGVAGSGLPGGIAPDAKFIFSDDLPTAFQAGITEDATKITYYTPRFSGVQFGASYTPDQGDGGTAAGFTGDNGTDYENVFNLGLNYTAQQGQVGIQASVTGEFADNESAAMENLNAYALGLVLSYGSFSVAGSYGDWNDSFQAVGSTDDSDYWTLGGAYEQGPVGVSATYLNSDFAGNELDLLSLGADYQLAAGLVPYVEVNIFDADEAGTSVDNDGTVVLVGTELTF